jgi:excisionase family DNA binding protein
MATSPTPTVSESGCCGDVFDQLAQYERLLTAKELARILAISPKTIYSYVERNMIPYYKIEANVRFRAREVAEWLRDRGEIARLSVESGDPLVTHFTTPFSSLQSLT